MMIHTTLLREREDRKHSHRMVSPHHQLRNICTHSCQRWDWTQWNQHSTPTQSPLHCTGQRQHWAETHRSWSPASNPDSDWPCWCSTGCWSTPAHCSPRYLAANQILGLFCVNQLEESIHRGSLSCEYQLCREYELPSEQSPGNKIHNLLKYFATSCYCANICVQLKSNLSGRESKLLSKELHETLIAQSSSWQLNIIISVWSSVTVLSSPPEAGLEVGNYLTVSVEIMIIGGSLLSSWSIPSHK